jgi:hypothetical protein
MTLEERSKELEQELAEKFLTEVKREWPMDDTAPHSKDQWEQKDNKVINTAPYADILWTGRVYKDRWYGSEQLPNGGDELLRNFLRRQ